MDGILNINKPGGKTSFSIVSIVKRLSGERRVGHAGTLDPAATGVLPICLGRGTRVAEYLLDASKAYRAEIELGVSTDTYDADGRVVQMEDASGISLEQLESAVFSFYGSIQQTPPMYSAVKYRGRPLYQWARAGVTVERRSRLVKIDKIELLDWQPPVVTIEVVCGKGTYIRCLAEDLGKVLGCGAHLKSLIRLRCGLFGIRDAISVSQLEDAFYHGYWQQYVYPPDSILLHWEAMLIKDDAKQRISNGRPLELGDGDSAKVSSYPEQHVTIWSSSQNRCRAYTLDGCFLGVLRFDSERREWQPEKMFI